MKLLTVNLFAISILWPAYAQGICDQPSSTNPCSRSCGQLTSCGQCLTASNCNWCFVSSPKISNNHGWCTSADASRQQNFTDLCNISSDHGPNQTVTSISSIYWYNSSCPMENECENGHHNCDLAVQYCVDKENGFECQCKDGYVGNNGFCIPFCSDGCVNGICIRPNVCQCFFGFVGSTCTAACNCFGHSTCPGPQELDTCLMCHNHTKGAHCEFCETGYIRFANSCLSCREYCHNHSDTCVSAKKYNLLQNFMAGSSNMVSMSEDWSFDQSDNDQTTVSVSVAAPICVNCSDFTKGLQCEFCVPGYFRQPGSPPEMPCTQCDCNGHSMDNVCNPRKGDGCDCRNNTMTPHGCRDDECWRMQCAMCKDGFRGVPVNGRQCYRELNEADQDICFVPDDCSRFQQSRPLLSMKLSFFVLIPEFSNIDLRIIIDVGQGVLDAFLAATDTFVANYDSVAGCNVLSWRLIGDGESTRSFMDGMDNAEPCVPGGGSNWASVKIKDANDYLANYIIYDSPSTLLILRGVANRAVIVIPASLFDLKTTRFYLVIRARRYPSAGAWGNLLYVQEQAHFDLFIFFAVFFAAFFLVLSAVLVLWRLKMVHSGRRHDQAQTMELMKMAKRPFGSISIFWKDDKAGECSKNVESIEPWPFCFQNVRKKPAAVATLLVRMPGGPRAPVRLALATTLLITTAPARNMKPEVADNPAAIDSAKKRSRRYLLPSNRCRVQPC